MKNIKVNYFSESKKWPRRIPKIKEISKKTINKMNSYFKRDHRFELNIILTDKSKMIKLNKIYKNKQSDTDVLTFISKNSNKYSYYLVLIQRLCPSQFYCFAIQFDCFLNYNKSVSYNLNPWE